VTLSPPPGGGPIGIVVPAFRGHVNATFKLARDLVRAGHEVVYFGPEEARPWVTSSGFTFRPSTFARPLALRTGTRHGAEGGRRGSFRALPARRREGQQLLASAPQIVGEVTRLARTLRPSLMLFDPFVLFYALPFLRCGVRVASLNSFLLLDHDPLVPPWTSSLVPRPDWAGRLQVAAAWGACWARYLRYRLGTALESLVTGYSPRRLGDQVVGLMGGSIGRAWHMRPVWYDFRLRGVPELILSAREFDLPRARPLRPAVRFLGPCVDLERSEPRFDWRQVDLSGRQLVYCALGTVRLQRDGADVSFLERMVAAFAGDPRHALVVSTSSPEMTSRLGRRYPNVHVFDEVPQLQVLGRASLMITPGGSNSVRECLQLRVPMLVYPRHNDQPGNAARVVHHGLGLAGDPRRDSSELIRRRSSAVIEDPRVRANLVRMGATIDRYLRDEVHVRAIEDLLASPCHPGSPSAANCDI
jgi:zeaxanthin glucosyltransferase